MTVSPGAVLASVPATLAFVYSLEPRGCLKGGDVALTVPTRWTRPSDSTVPGTPGQVMASCIPGCKLTVVNTMTIMLTGVSLYSGQSLFIIYADATAPGTPGRSDFRASEQSSGTLKDLAPSPSVQVVCPDGAGTMGVSPPTVAAASGHPTLIFTYTAGSCGVQDGGQVRVTIPDDWPSPSPSPGTPGCASPSPFGAPVLHGRTVTVTVADGGIAPGHAGMITCAWATAAPTVGPDLFRASEKSAPSGTLTAINSVTVSVTPATSPPDGNGGSVSPSPLPGTMIVRPELLTAGHRARLIFTYTAPGAGLAASGAVALAVPPGWARPQMTSGKAGYVRASAGALSVRGGRVTVTGASLRPGQKLTITYHAGIVPRQRRTWIFTASDTAATATLASLPMSPAVTVTAMPPPTLPWPLILLAAGLLAAACAVVVLTAHRRGSLPSIRARSHPGPPGPVTVRNTGTDATVTVRIDPHPGAAVIVSDRTSS